jgi:hypothetical protein
VRRLTSAGSAATLLLAPVAATAQAVNESGAQGLLVPIGARVVGVGGAAAAARFGGESVPINPAALGFATVREISLQHGQDAFARRDLLTFVAPSRRVGTFAVTGYLVDYGSEPEIDEFQTQTGTYYLRNVALTATYASTVRQSLSLGLTYRLYQFRADCSGSCLKADQYGVFTTSMVDVGAQYDFAKQKLPLVLGASVRYLGLRLQVKDSDQKDPLPTQIDVGARYEIPAVARELKDARLSVSADVVRGVSAGGAATSFHVGTEGSFRERVLLRAGWVQRDAGESGPSVGFGFQAKRWGLDVARSLSGVSVDVGEPPTFVALRYNF